VGQVACVTGENGVKRARRRWRLSPYVARHERLTELRRTGADLADVQAYAGHVDASTTKRYAPTVEGKVLAAVVRAEQRLAETQAARTDQTRHDNAGVGAVSSENGHGQLKEDRP
jgi:integrase